MTEPAFRNERLGLQAASIAVLAALLWGGNAVFIKMGLQGVPPLAMALFRFALGTGVVVVAIKVAGVRLRLPPEERLGVAVLGVIFVLQILLLNFGTNHTTASRSTVMITAHPIFTALAAHFLIPGDRLNPGRVVGLSLSFGGILLVFADALIDQGLLLGDLLVLLSALLLGLRQVAIKRIVHGLNPYTLLFWQAAPSLPVFALLSLMFEGQADYVWSPEVVGAILYQGLVVAGLCFILWVSLMRHHSASRLGAFGFATPLCGVFLSHWLLDEAVTLTLLLSVGLVAVGIFIANRSGS